jgi:hypothetical protein
MKKAVLLRNYARAHTAGVFVFPRGQFIYTVERPWIDEEGRAGKPFSSCIPEGLYEIKRFKRANGSLVWVLVNEDLGVYEREEDREHDTDRYACLIHIANKVEDVVGCVGPGMGAFYDKNGRYQTTYSRKAMERLESLLVDITHIEIKEAA